MTSYNYSRNMRASHRVSSSDQPSAKASDSCHFVLFVLIVAFSINANLATNALWIQLPTLLPQVPEGSALRTCFIVILELGNIAAVAILIVRKYTRITISEVPFIYSSFAVSFLSLTLAALFWQTAPKVWFGYFSYILMFCAFMSSLVSCTSPLTYIPFGAKIRPVYVPAVLLGCVLSETIPHLIAFLQGIGEFPDCSLVLALTNRTQVKPDNTHGTILVKTTPEPLLPPETKFDEFYFFFGMAVTVFFSAVWFAVIRHSCGLFQEEPSSGRYEEVNSADVEELRHDVAIAAGNDDLYPNAACVDTVVLDDGSVRLPRQQLKRGGGYATSHSDAIENSCSNKHRDAKRHGTGMASPHRDSKRHGIGMASSPWRGNYNNNCSRDVAAPAVRTTSNGRVSSTSSSFRMSTTSSVTSERPNTFPLLMLLTFWSKCILSGPLSSVKAHACYPAGNPRMLAGVVTSNSSMMIACLASLRMHRQSRVTIVFALTSLATITWLYFVALIGFSYDTEDSNSLIFKTEGEVLGTMAWMTMSGLFYLGLSTVGIVCAESGAYFLSCYCLFYLMGEALGTMVMFGDFNVCKAYQRISDCDNE